MFAVKISKAPGCTQNVNYFAFETKKKVKLTYLVDLPGYGYAAAAKMDRKRWADTMTSFLKGRDFTVMRYDIDSQEPCCRTEFSFIPFTVGECTCLLIPGAASSRLIKI